MPSMNNFPLPVLMYHAVVAGPGSIPTGREIGADLYDVSLENFTQQIAWLADQGYQTVHPPEIKPVQKRVVITFDDGEHNNFQHAWPVLRQRQLRAYFFVTIKRIGLNGYMKWSELKELVAGGMMIGAHGYTHEILTALTDAQLRHELVYSRRILEENLQVEINSLSIPRGFYDQRVLSVAQEAGYRHIFVSEKKRSSDPCWSRTAVKKDWNLERFCLAVKGKRPLNEIVFDSVRRLAKGVLGSATYDAWRSKILTREAK